MLHLDVGRLQTLTVVTLVFSGQAVFYVSRERQHLWSWMPGTWLIISSMVDLGIISTLATTGTLMRALPREVIGGVLGAVFVFVFILDAVKIALFRRLAVA